MGLAEVFIRFPITVILLVALVINNTIKISNFRYDSYSVLLLALAVGIFLSLVLELIYEGFLRIPAIKLISAILSAGAVLFYYWIIREVDTATSIRTIVILFILIIFFLWIPSLKSEVNFSESFIVSFKAFFTAFFFSFILFCGIALILQAINVLILPLSSNAYAHAANITFLLYGPIHFLSLIPFYWTASGGATEGDELQKTDEAVAGRPDEQEVLSYRIRSSRYRDRLRKAVEVPKFLESLITYVIIPITAVFSVILLLYIIMNITDNFWTNNLMEPLLISYSITVILVYLLSGKLDNKLSKGFRRIFPKVMLPIVLFQTVASIIKIREMGVTYGRYYIILFGIYAAIAGFIFCLVPVKRIGIIAPILIITAFISILPPVDAFTVSRSSQIGRLKRVLSTRGMLVDDAIVPNPNLSEADQKKIINAIDYLERMGYTDEISWLSEYSSSYNFEKTFGFSRYGSIDREYRSLYFYLNPETMIGISGYDFLYSTTISNKVSNLSEASFLLDGTHYFLDYEQSGEHTDLLLIREEEELLRLSVNDIFDRFDSWGTDNYSTEISEDDARFTAENERAILTLTVRNLNIDYWQDEISLYADAYILIRMK
jgi:hypothetical protein